MKPHIKLKSQAARHSNLVVMPNRRNKIGDEAATSLNENAAHVIRECPQLAGYVLVAWDAEGTNFTQIYNASTSPIQRLLLPHFVSEAIRRELAGREARDIIKDTFGIK